MYILFPTLVLWMFRLPTRVATPAPVLLSQRQLKRFQFTSGPFIVSKFGQAWEGIFPCRKRKKKMRTVNVFCFFKIQDEVLFLFLHFVCFVIFTFVSLSVRVTVASPSLLEMLSFITSTSLYSWHPDHLYTCTCIMWTPHVMMSKGNCERLSINIW